MQDSILGTTLQPPGLIDLLVFVNTWLDDKMNKSM